MIEFRRRYSPVSSACTQTGHHVFTSLAAPVSVDATTGADRTAYQQEREFADSIIKTHGGKRTALGAVLGLALDSIGLGIAIGVAIGVAREKRQR